jgi:hypothetical protein
MQPEPELELDQVRFFHFIGTYRFRDGVYARQGRNVIASISGKRELSPELTT